MGTMVYSLRWVMQDFINRILGELERDPNLENLPGNSATDLVGFRRTPEDQEMISAGEDRSDSI